MFYAGLVTDRVGPFSLCVLSSTTVRLPSPPRRRLRTKERRIACPSPPPACNSSVNVEALAQSENAEAKTVLSAMKRRGAEKRLAAQEAEHAATLPDPTPQRRRHHHHHHHHRRKRSSAGGVSLPPAQPSPLKQAQLLRQRKEHTAAMARASLEKGSNTDGSGDGRAMPDAEGSGEEDRLSSSREAARHLALQAASEGVGNYSLSDSFSDWARYYTELALLKGSCG